MGDADRHEEPVSADDQGDPSGPDGQGGPGRPVCQSIPADSEASGVASGPGSPCDPCGAGGEGAAAGGAPQAARAPHAPGSGGDAVPVAGGAGSRLLTFTLTVPFGSALQAEMAFSSLMPDIHRQGQAVQRITVNGSVLAVRWSAQDLGILGISINALLNDLSLIMRNIQRIAPLFSRSLSWEKRPET
ncbi:EKC/KEOPS complex subunit LAGE3-like [Dasypus novemcinctus]|uniref:EKC/KEOPS complex subunit LAGE3-like n=1 Tax=Dasypus novemcinctus TaxID=9361 RepID=UPI0026603867|nr:EKC/KEOPS complex subunit LAGE3-like [Dasypus novemcinctus]